MVKIHFLNVGHGDCSIIEHASGRLTMIDINNACSLDEDSRREIAAAYGITGVDYLAKKIVAERLGRSFRKTYLREAGYDIELTDPVDYFKAVLPNRDIFRFILTHADLDHMRGLVRLRHEKVDILNFWDTAHLKSITDFQNNDEAEWNEYQRLRRSANMPQVLRLTRGEDNKYWNQDDAGGDGDGLYILAPTAELQKAANAPDDPNAHSYVLMLIYAGVRVVFGGDATEAVWESVYRWLGKNLKCHVLKASHHGRDSGCHSNAIAAMHPDYTIVSVGTKPETDASNKYRGCTTKGVWSTRWHGNILVTIKDDGTYSIDSDRQRRDRLARLAAVLGTRMS
jgi:competence protein ComEC